MTTLLRRARWPLFGVGLVLILVAGIGWATNAPWGNIFNSFSVIFGTMMSFAQMFVSFPTTTIGRPQADGRGAAPVPPQTMLAKSPDYASRYPNYPQGGVQQYPYYPSAPQQQYPDYAPPPPPPPQVSPYAMPAQAQSQPKRYKWSGIALWIGAGCALLQIYSVLTAASGGAGLQDVYDYYALIFLQGVCFLCALRGIHAKHARTAGALGVIAIMVIGGALLLSIIASTIYVGSANSATYAISPDAVRIVQTFNTVDSFFVVVGDILLGISLIYGKVYSAWIGVGGIILGCVALFEIILASGGASASSIAALTILGLLLSSIQNAALGWILFKKPPLIPVRFY